MGNSWTQCAFPTGVILNGGIFQSCGGPWEDIWVTVMILDSLSKNIGFGGK